MTLTFDAQVRDRRLDVQLSLASGERIAVLGPNGAGKSSTLAVLAGLLRPDSGRAELDGRTLFDLRADRPVWRPPHDRGVALLAQDALLFPHLSVLDNIAFGPRSAGRSRQQARATAHEWLERVGGDPGWAQRRPGSLSGGQAQRVALARALATDPRLLLLDEPLAALDVTAAPMLRQVLRRVLTDRSAIIVTHDLLDALVLAQNVVVIDQGAVVEAGPTSEVLRHPRSPFTARIAGLNMVTGSADPRGVRSADGRVIEGMVSAPVPSGQPAIAVFTPSAVSVFSAPPHGSPRNTVEMTITELEPREDQVRVRALSAGGVPLTADVTASAVSELELYPGTSAYFSFKASAVTVYPA